MFVRRLAGEVIQGEVAIGFKALMLMILLMVMIEYLLTGDLRESGLYLYRKQAGCRSQEEWKLTARERGREWQRCFSCGVGQVSPQSS